MSGVAEREPVTLIQQRGEFELDLRLGHARRVHQIVIDHYAHGVLRFFFLQARLMRNCRAGMSVKNGLGGKFDLSTDAPSAVSASKKPVSDPPQALTQRTSVGGCC